MKILFLTTHVNTGGITSYLLTLSRGLVASGNSVTVVSSGGNMSDEFARRGVRNVILNIRTKSEADPRIYWPLRRLARYVREEAVDVIHAHTRVTQVMGECLKRMTGQPYVSTCHGFFKRRLSRRVLPCWGDAVIAISPAVRDHLQRDFGVPAGRIALIMNGLDITDFEVRDQAYRDAKRQELGVPPGPVIGIIARLSDVKGQHVLIRAMTRVVNRDPQARLLIMGEGRAGESLRRQVGELGLQANIFFHPVVNRTAEYLPVFDIFVMPSLSEGLGLSVMEAQAAALPVVASRVGGIPSLIEHGKTGILVSPNDPEELARGLIDLLTDPQKARVIGRQARAFIVEECSAEKMVAQTSDLYRRLRGAERIGEGIS